MTDGKVVLDIEGCVSSEHELVRKIEVPLQVAESLALADDSILDRLAWNATEDPDLAVRINALRAIAGAYPDLPPGIRARLRPLLGDGRASVRFHTARTLGDEGFGTLKALVKGGNGDLSARALEYLSGRLSPEELRPLVQKSLLAGGELLHLAALRVLGSLGDPGMEGSAARLLNSPSKDVRLAAVEALGRIGTASSVTLLRGFSVDLLDFDTRAAVGRAIGMIKGRLTGAEEGQVSLAADDAPEGRVSLAEDTGEGRLSLTEDNGKGRLSLGDSDD